MITMGDHTDEPLAAIPNPERERKKAEMIRDHAPHPVDVAHLVADYEHIDAGKWKIEASDGGWYEDVIHGLYMEGYLIRGTELNDETGNIIHTVIEKRRLETGVCPNCGERNEPDRSGDGVTCPDCGDTW